MCGGTEIINIMNVLISLHKGYGLGDAVQMSAVLRHVRKYRPNWIIDFQAEEGRECVGNGIAHNTFVYGQSYPSSHYDAEVQMMLFDTWYGWYDRPNTRVSSCLRERFGLEWDAECGRYEINVSDHALQIASKIIPHRPVAIHYQGDSAPDKKNLSHNQGMEICDAIFRLGHIPLLLDWRNQWPLHLKRMIRTTGAYYSSRDWGRSAEMNCAVIKQCRAFIGIDSGPSKCASATDTPSLVVWTGHHPAAFHDPAPNTTHLVPVGYHALEPVCNNPGVIKWFEANHKVITYDGDPMNKIKGWLARTLT